MTLTRREVLDLLARHDLRPRRALGQNFVVDPNTVRRVAALAAVGPGDHVLEIGAGVGSLTLALAETGAHVLAMEVDRHLVPVLRTVVAGAGVEVVEADALRVDWAALLEAHRWALVANLPYNVATPLILDLLGDAPQVETMLVMVQREVAERLAAGPGHPAYGAVSVKVAYWAEASVVGRVPPSVFKPVPKVESALVRIRRRARPGVDGDREWLFRLVAAGFATRRKMLRRSLADLVGPEGFAAAGVRPEARAEELDLPAWGRLAAASSPRERGRAERPRERPPAERPPR